MNTTNNKTIQDKIKEIFDLYYKYGSCDYIGEPVTQTEHMILAAMCAEEDLAKNKYLASPKDRDYIILAAFLHDIGHLIGVRDNLAQMSSWGTLDHDIIAGKYLRSLNMPELICKLVENHVIAKRYLVTTDVSYYDKLSEASKKTLEFQGGKMSKEEILAFEKDKYNFVYINFRQWEEEAKISRDKINCISKYKKLCQDILEREQQKENFRQINNITNKFYIG